MVSNDVVARNHARGLFGRFQNNGKFGLEFSVLLHAATYPGIKYSDMSNLTNFDVVDICEVAERYRAREILTQEEGVLRFLERGLYWFLSVLEDEAQILFDRDELSKFYEAKDLLRAHVIPELKIGLEEFRRILDEMAFKSFEYSSELIDEYRSIAKRYGFKNWAPVSFYDGDVVNLVRALPELRSYRAVLRKAFAAGVPVLNFVRGKFGELDVT